MIELHPDQMVKPIAKAKRVRNHIRMIAWRKYEVRTPLNRVYTVTFDVQAGKKMAACNCPATGICYHIASAAQVHCLIARMRAEQEPVCEPAPAPMLPPVKPQPPSLGRMGGIEL